MDRAREVLPGGVNSPVRSYHSVGGDPPVIARGDGPHVWDADGNRYVDFVGSYGPLILGHAPRAVVRAIEEAAGKGTSFGAPTETETELASLVVDRVPSVELVRFVNSGTEAAMSAVRLARAATGRDLMLKFDGCYHGHADGLLAAAGSGVATFGLPDSAGVPGAFAGLTIVAEYNNIPATESAFERHGGQIAAAIVEPCAGNMGVVGPEPGFLERLRDLCTEAGSLLIFDEVITGFRVASGGAQELLGVKPDLTTLGKILGGGLPVGAYGGRRELMELVAPVGPVYQAGTLSGNPLAMAAGLATLKGLGPAIYKRLESTAATLQTGLENVIAASEVEASVSRIGSLLTLFFLPCKPRSFAEAKGADGDRFTHFHGRMLSAGVHLPPSQYEAWFISAAHDAACVDQTLAAARDAFGTIE